MLFSHSSFSSSGHQSILKRMDIPVFTGEILHYPQFRANFKLLVESSMSSEQALYRLRTESLTSDSIEFHLAHSRSTLSEVWEELDSYFCTRSVLRYSILIELRELEVVNDVSDHHGLRRMTARVRSLQETVKLCGFEHVLDDDAFAILMMKIPPVLREKIDLNIFDNKLLTCDEHLAVFVRECTLHSDAGRNHELRSLAYGHSPSMVTPRCDVKIKSHVKKPRSMSFCVFHERLTNHRSRRCMKVIDMSPSSVFDCVRKHNRCFVCFGHHQAKDCCAKSGCPEKGCPNPRTHSKFLHPVMSCTARSIPARPPIVTDIPDDVSHCTHDSGVGMSEVESESGSSVDESVPECASANVKNKRFPAPSDGPCHFMASSRSQRKLTEPAIFMAGSRSGHSLPSIFPHIRNAVAIIRSGSRHMDLDWRSSSDFG